MNDASAINAKLRDINDVPAVEIITVAAINLMSAAAVKCGLSESNGEEELDLDEARKLINALAGLIHASSSDLGTFHSRSLKDGLTSLQLAFREASAIPDLPGQGPGEQYSK